jgi:hypothetical protein
MMAHVLAMEYRFVGPSPKCRPVRVASEMQRIADDLCSAALQRCLQLIGGSPGGGPKGNKVKRPNPLAFAGARTFDLTSL